MFRYRWSLRGSNKLVSVAASAPRRSTYLLHGGRGCRSVIVVHGAQNLDFLIRKLNNHGGFWFVIPTWPQGGGLQTLGNGRSGYDVGPLIPRDLDLHLAPLLNL